MLNTKLGKDPPMPHKELEKNHGVKLEALLKAKVKTQTASERDWKYSQEVSLPETMGCNYFCVAFEDIFDDQSMATGTSTITRAVAAHEGRGEDTGEAPLPLATQTEAKGALLESVVVCGAHQALHSPTRNFSHKGQL